MGSTSTENIIAQYLQFVTANGEVTFVRVCTTNLGAAALTTLLGANSPISVHLARTYLATLQAKARRAKMRIM